jgi:hypothetical protein
VYETPGQIPDSVLHTLPGLHIDPGLTKPARRFVTNELRHTLTDERVVRQRAIAIKMTSQGLADLKYAGQSS